MLVRALIATVRWYGVPRALRNDNEPSLWSVLFRLVLGLLRISHQRSLPHCPWQNGRIARFFATFKDRALRRLAELRAAGAEPVQLQGELDTFRRWYNHARPHPHLDGRTPAEARDGIRPIETHRQQRYHLFTEWDGLLVGYVPR